ncbi:DUF6817 domain-containing protein [Streptomyces sp. NPDC090022]|uniref:DUF6817 domain-containing protein n=1 Tax=Streptomyces sp. NPDC090022 TaxID=3365920 RepID=UPI00381C4C5C
MTADGDPDPIAPGGPGASGVPGVPGVPGGSAGPAGSGGPAGPGDPDGPVARFLRSRGAAAMDHPGGTLLDHLGRVAEVLGRWGAARDVRLAGLCHAAYGTDGFGPHLMETAERGTLAGLIGERAEAIVYLYGSSVRDVLYPQIGGPGPVTFRDRFTGAVHEPAEADLRALMEITAANELDVLAHNADLAARHGAALYGFFARGGELLSPGARAACERQLAPYA